jgi:hypothetical protein
VIFYVNKLNDETTDQNQTSNYYKKSIKEQKYEEVNGQIDLFQVIAVLD